jgi:DNA-binding SARP family transcriptional activator
MLITRLLGAQAVLDGATGRIRTGSSRTLALLGLLIARSGRPQDRVTIAGLFWPESGNAQALTNLRRELHDLRRILGEDDSLEITPGQLCWHDRGRHDIDLSTFLRETAAVEAASDEVSVTHGSAALEHYGGPLLPGLNDEWLDALRSELEQRCTALCQRVYRAARATGRTDVAMVALGKLLTVDPFNESAHRALIQLHVDSGDRAGAISVYHRLATLLERELGVAPASETTALVTQLLGETARLGTLSARDALDIAEPDLVGRTAEVSTSLASWHDSSAGHARVLAVHGGAGVGKSRLVSELVRRARSEGTVVGRSVCFDTGGRLSLAPVADWLRHTELIATKSRRNADRGRLATAPVLRGRRASPAGARATLAPRPRQLAMVRSGHAELCSFPSQLRSPGSTAGGDHGAIRRAGPAPDYRGLARPDARRGAPHRDQPGAVGPCRDDCTRDGTDRSEVRRGRGQTPVRRNQWLPVVRGRGRPLGRSGPTGRASSGQLLGWMGILPKRIQQLSPAAREVAGLAAALGRDFNIPLLAEASDLDVETVVVAVDELWWRRIIRQIRDRYDFSHDLLRSAAYDAVTPARRWLLHRRLAQALELLWAGHTDTVAAQIAEQYRLAGNPERALRYYERAAEVAAAMFAHGDAITFLTAARHLLASMPHGRDRDERVLTLLEMSIPPLNALHGYSSPLVREACERSVNLADELNLTARMVTAMVGLWSSRFVEGRLQESFELAQETVNLVGPGDERFGQAHFLLAQVRDDTGHRHQRRGRQDRPVGIDVGQLFALPVDDRTLQFKPADELGALIVGGIGSYPWGSGGRRHSPTLSHTGAVIRLWSWHAVVARRSKLVAGRAVDIGRGSRHDGRPYWAFQRVRTSGSKHQSTTADALLLSERRRRRRDAGGRSVCRRWHLEGQCRSRRPERGRTRRCCRGHARHARPALWRFVRRSH